MEGILREKLFMTLKANKLSDFISLSGSSGIISSVQGKENNVFIVTSDSLLQLTVSPVGKSKAHIIIPEKSSIGKFIIDNIGDNVEIENSSIINICIAGYIDINGAVSKFCSDNSEEISNLESTFYDKDKELSQYPMIVLGKINVPISRTGNFVISRKFKEIRDLAKEKSPAPANKNIDKNSERYAVLKELFGDNEYMIEKMY